MNKTDPLSFLDAPDKDPLSFLDAVPVDTTPVNKKKDPLAFLDAPSEEIPKEKGFISKYADIVKEGYNIEGEEPSFLREMLAIGTAPARAMSGDFRMPKIQKLPAYAKGLGGALVNAGLPEGYKTEAGEKFTKGFGSAMTLGGSELIPGMKVDDSFEAEAGQIAGTLLPFGVVQKYIAGPLGKFAASKASSYVAPVAKTVAEWAGFSLGAAATESAEQLIKEGRLPTAEEFGDNVVKWLTIDAVMKAIGLSHRFKSAVQDISQTSGKSQWQVLKDLGISLKNYVRRGGKPFDKASNINPEEVVKLVEDAEKIAGQQPKPEPKPEPPKPPEPITIEVKPEPVAPKPVTPKEQQSNLPKEYKDREIYRGYGRKNKESVYGYTSGGIPILGEGMYYTFDKKTASTFGPKIESRKLDLQNPLVIKNDDQWRAYAKKAGWAFPNPSGLDKEQRLLEIGKFQNQLIRDGYDGVIIDFLPGDEINAKTLDNAFGSPQVFIPTGKVYDVSNAKVKQNLGQIDDKIDKVKQQDISSKGLKEQKQYFLNELNNALTKPTEAKTIRVEIPGDGVFNIVNSPDAIQAAIKRVEKKWPEKIPETAKPPAHKVKKPKPKAELKSKPLASKPEEKKRVPVIPETRPKDTNPMGKGQAVARSKIIDLLRKAFHDPIRLGKFKQKALGIHKGWPKVTRLLHDNDVETAAHEIGHNLHYTLYSGNAINAEEQRTNTQKALQPYLNELKPIARYEPFTLEGFAEFTRMYVTNPDVAKKLAPNFYAKFEADLERDYPELKNALLEARDYYAEYLEGTPESRIRAQTSYSEDVSTAEKLAEVAREPKKFDRLITSQIDDMFPAKRMISDVFDIPLSAVEGLEDPKNVYRSLRILKGAIGKADVFAMFETFDPITLARIGPGYRDILIPLKKKADYREFNDYLIARRAIELHGRMIEPGVSLGDAKATVNKLKGKWEPLAKQFDAWNDAVLQYAQKAGLISKDLYKIIKRKNLQYAPFQRDIKKARFGTGKGLQAGKPIKKIKGSKRNIIPPVESALRNMYNIIIQSEKNLTAQVFAELSKAKNAGMYIERVPTPIKLQAKVLHDEIEKATIKHLLETGQDEFLVIDSNGRPTLSEEYKDILPEVILKFGPGTYGKQENIITVYRDGKPEYYEVSPEIYEMWTKGTEPYTANLITKILRIPTRMLRAGAILNPKFIAKNFIRDTWGSWLQTKFGKSVKDPVGLMIDSLYQPLAMMAVAARKGPLYVEWLKSGGGMSTMQSLSRDAVVKKIKEIRDGYSYWQVIKWLRQAAEISEEANRLNEFAKALQVNSNTRIGKEIAAFASRDLSIDFAKMGLQAKMLNQIIGFWNATVQGGDKFIRMMSNPEDRAKFLPRWLAMVVLPSLILAYLNRDDERMDEFSDQEQDFNYITFVGDRAIKIPVPFEPGVIGHGLTTRMYKYFMKHDPAAFEGFMGSVASASLPNLIPNWAEPFIEIYANKDFFRGAPIVPKDKENLVSKYQYKRGTSVTARSLGRAMTYMLGEDTRNKAAAPAVIDHFINSWTGGLGRIMIEISDASLVAAGLADKVEGPDRSIAERLGFDAFTVKYPRASSKSIDKFYNNYFDAKSRLQSYKKADKEELEGDKAIEQGYRRIEKIYDMDTLDSAYKAMRECQKEINMIWRDPSLDPKLKEQMVNDLYLEQVKFAKAANEDIRRYRLAQ